MAVTDARTARLISSVPGRPEFGALGQHAPAGDVVDLEPDAGRVQERHRVVARRPRALLGSTRDLRADPLRQRVRLVDVLAATGAEAQVLKSRRLLDVLVV